MKLTKASATKAFEVLQDCISKYGKDEIIEFGYMKYSGKNGEWDLHIGEQADDRGFKPSVFSDDYIAMSKKVKGVNVFYLVSK